MTKEEVQTIMDEEHGLRVAAIEKSFEKCADQLPKPQLWAPEEVEKLAAAVSDPGLAVYNEPKRELVLEELDEWNRELIEGGKELAAAGFGKLPEKEVVDTPGDIRDPLKHIRVVLVQYYPEAATATDEELEKLYDQLERE